MNKIYKVMYYIDNLFALLAIVLISCFTKNIVSSWKFVNLGIVVLIIILFAIANYYLIKNKDLVVDEMDLVIPIAYSIFLLITTICAYGYNLNAVIDYFHFSYYYSFTVFPLVVLNVYTIYLAKNNK